MTELTPCVHCGSPWHAESIPIQHTPACPFMTNLWPVLDSDLADDLGCIGCGVRFDVGDSYVTCTIFEDTSEVLCLGCGATNESENA